MPRVRRLELLSVDLPFRRTFRHAAAARERSESLFLRCATDASAPGFGECLPREYVTGETREGAFALLREAILPRLVGMEFESMKQVRAFLEACDGKAPPEWVGSELPQAAAWCAVDLALLDAFGRAFGEPVRMGVCSGRRPAARFSGVVSEEGSWLSLLKMRLWGFENVKLKSAEAARRARAVMGKRCVLRVDANMAWDRSTALQHILELERAGVACVEQPLAADDLDGLAWLVRETRMPIVADESFSDRASLERLVEHRACTGVNVRISKCGGLVAAARRCEEARRAGLTVQIGCHVGESSLLSAAQLVLISAVPEAQDLEGCYGRHLLRVDPVRPRLQLGYGGRAPRLPEGPGLGVEVDESELERWGGKRVVVECRS